MGRRLPKAKNSAIRSGAVVRRRAASRCRNDRVVSRLRGRAPTAHGAVGNSNEEGARPASMVTP